VFAAILGTDELNIWVILGLLGDAACIATISIFKMSMAKEIFEIFFLILYGLISRWLCIVSLALLSYILEWILKL
jgi:hypothetical protein